MVDTPKFLEMVDDASLLVEDWKNLLTSDVIKSDNTIAHSCCLEDLDPANLVSVVTMCTAACLDVGFFDVDDTEVVSWNDTSLVEAESILLLGFSLIHEVFLDWSAL